MISPLLHQLFVHLPVFERTAKDVLNDEELRAAQVLLVQDPRAGDMVAGTGGVRKIRVATRYRGKRGSARIIYYYVERRERIYLLLAYAKNDKADLTEAEKKAVRNLVQQLEAED
jgi:hypothetical protein